MNSVTANKGFCRVCFSVSHTMIHFFLFFFPLFIYQGQCTKYISLAKRCFVPELAEANFHPQSPGRCTQFKTFTDFYMLCKWENLLNQQCIKYLFSPLLVIHLVCAGYRFWIKPFAKWVIEMESQSVSGFGLCTFRLFF